MRFLFEIIGMVASAAMLCGLVVILYVTIRDSICGAIYDHRVKHRFDKPPTAKCYCHDCKWHGGEYPNTCRLPGVSRMTPPDGFCYEATPRQRRKV